MTSPNNPINIPKDIEDHIWHPYSSPKFKIDITIDHAQNCFLYTDTGHKLLDSISSWWCVQYGHNNPVILEAIHQQTKSLTHVMLGGLTHKPVQQLTTKLKELLNNDFYSFFYGDSGSIAVEVALKMALQYHSVNNPNKKHFMCLKYGYHGDTYNAMLVSDPSMGMHKLFNSDNPNFFITPPTCLQPSSLDYDTYQFTDTLTKEQILSSPFIQELTQVLNEHHQEIAAFILEPFVQGAGNMNIYDIRYLDYAIELCKKYNVLVIFDEIATGFGRTGRDFAYQYLENKPNIITIGKALTAGHITMGATCVDKQVTKTITNQPPYVFMHGPTFMASPLSCSVALASIGLFNQCYTVKDKISHPLTKFTQVYKTYRNKILDLNNANVKDVRFIGNIFVIEFNDTVDRDSSQKFFYDRNIWIRSINNILYILPPYVIEPQDLEHLVRSMYDYVKENKFLKTDQVTYD